MTDSHGASCPLCEEPIGPDGACTSIDCDFVACPFCPPSGGIAAGFPTLDKGRPVRSCKHLVLLESGEADAAALAEEIPAVPEIVTVPPPKDWFHEGVHADLTTFAEAEGLPEDETLELSSERWTGDLLEWIGKHVAARQAAVRRSSHFGTASYWVADPEAYWSEVTTHVTHLTEWMRRLSGVTVGVMFDDPHFIVANRIPKDLPEGLNGALRAFIGERTELTPGMQSWLEARVGAGATARIARAAEGWWFWQEEASSAVNVLVGLLVLDPALDDLDDDSWWFRSSGAPAGWDPRGGGLWGDPIMVADRSALDDAQAPYLSALAQLAKDLTADDWVDCESCDGLRPGEDNPCLDGCPVHDGA